MKKILALLLAVCVVMGCVGAVSAEQETAILPASYVQVPCSKDGVAEFMAAFALTQPNGVMIDAYGKEEDCYNVTPPDVARETDIRIFKFSHNGAGYALVDGRVFDLCRDFGGHGFLHAVPWDYDGDGLTDLLVAANWGSGLDRTEISVFNRATRTSTVIWSTMNEADPQICVMPEIVCLALSSKPEPWPEVVLRQVEIPLPEDGDYVHLQYRDLGQYKPAAPLATRLPAWNAEQAAPLTGSWYCAMEGYGTEYGILLVFTDDGQVSMRLIVGGKQYDNESEITVPYRTSRISGSSTAVVFLAEGESSACEYSVTDGELHLSLMGPVPLPFRRLTEEDAVWLASLEPMYRPGDISHAEIEYRTSEHFTRDDMDAAMAVVLEAFGRYYGCELYRLSYTDDEMSAREFIYYAGSRSSQTGRVYVDGMVLTSDFRTPPEEEGEPYSGFNPDADYNGWDWVLLLTEDGAWEIATTGY